MKQISLNDLADLPHGTMYLVVIPDGHEGAVFDNMSDAMWAAGYPADDVPVNPSGNIGISTLADQVRELLADDVTENGHDPFMIVPISLDMVHAIKEGHGNEALGRLERVTALVSDVYAHNELEPEYLASLSDYDLATDMIAFNDDIAALAIDTGNMGADFEKLAKEVAEVLRGIRNDATTGSTAKEVPQAVEPSGGD